jgi:hypothetical protein
VKDADAISPPVSANGVESLGFAVQARARSEGGEAVTETILEYLPALERVRTTMVEQNGNQPGDPHRGARAVIAAMSQETPPRRLVLGNGGFDAVTSTLTEALHDVPRSEALSRRADFPAS